MKRVWRAVQCRNGDGPFKDQHNVVSDDPPNGGHQTYTWALGGCSKKEADFLVERLNASEQTTGVDGEWFNLGRAEGRADVAAMLRDIVDPSDRGHLDLNGLLNLVKQWRMSTRCKFFILHTGVDGPPHTYDPCDREAGHSGRCES